MQHNSHKQTLAFIPGWGFQASIWHDIANQFPQYNSIFCDLPCVTDNIPEHMNQQLPNNCILIAWSLGGVIATDLCLRFPEKYSKLVLVNYTPKFVEGTNWPGISEENMHSFQQAAATNMFVLLRKFQQLVNGNNRNIMHKKFMQAHALSENANENLLFYLDLLATYDQRATYKKLSVPVLHILGDEDYLIPNHHENNAKVIAKAGHMPFITHSDTFTQHLQSFIHETSL